MDQKSNNYFSAFLPRVWSFRSIFDLQEFFENQGLRFETSDSEICDLLNELFHMNKNILNNLKKNNLNKLILGPFKSKLKKWSEYEKLKPDGLSDTIRLREQHLVRKGVSYECDQPFCVSDHLYLN